MVSDTSITADSPAGTGVVERHRDHPGGTSATSAADQFTYSAAAAPTVTGLSPTSGPAAGGTLVTITGTGFTGATAVDFGTTAATDVTVVSDTTITADSPAGTGVVDVTVTTPAGTSATSPADQFTYIVARTDGHGPEPDQRSDGRRHSGDDHRHRFHRRHGGRLRHDGGDRRHRGQRHLDHGRQPGGHRHRRRDRDHAGGTSATSAGRSVHLHAAAAPTVTGLSPTSGSTAGGTLVTITGTGFTGATAVDFGTTAATNVTVVSDTSITADSPAGTGRRRT